MTLVVRPQEPLSRHSPWRTGGLCTAYVVAHDEADVVTVVRDCRDVDMPLHVLGAGTRTVFRDGGFAGIVLRLGNAFSGVHGGEDGALHVGAACPAPALAEYAAANGFAGLEELCVCAGTVGAALLLDDGPGKGWSTVVRGVRHVWRNKIVEEEWSTFKERKHPVIVGVVLQVERDKPDAVRKRLHTAWRMERKRRVPPMSWYALPERGELRPLLRNVSLPGVRLRRVNIPPFSPELLVNLGEGTAEDLSLLHKSVLERVSRERAVELTSRMRFVGLSPDAAGRR